MRRRTILGGFTVIIGSGATAQNKYGILPANIPKFNSVTFTAESVTSLRGLSVSDIVDGMLAFVKGQSTLDDGNGGIYSWSPLSVAPDDGLDTIAPDGLSKGRWRRIASNNSAIIDGLASLTDLASNEVDKGAALVALPDGRSILESSGVMYEDAERFFESADVTSKLVGLRVFTKDGLAWDIVDDEGDFAHPVTGVGVRAAKIVTGLVPFWAFGAGRGGDDTAAFIRSMELQGAVVGRGSDTYILPQKIEIDRDLVIDWGGANIIAGPAESFTAANRNVLTLKPGCNLFEMRNLGSVRLAWLDAATGSGADLVSSFENADSSLGFPAGAAITSHTPAQVIIEDNQLGSARIALGAIDAPAPGKVTIARNVQNGAVPIYTYGMFLANFRGPEVIGNTFAADYIMQNPSFSNNRDMLKITGPYGDCPKVIRNFFEPTSLDSWCQVDLYTGGHGATISENLFRNAHLHRKTTAQLGVVPMIEADHITNNKWFIDRDPGVTSQALYYVGRTTRIAGNTMWFDPKLKLDGTTIDFINADDNGANVVSPSSALRFSSDFSFHGNTMSCEGVTGGTLTMVRIQPPEDGPLDDSRGPSLVGNIMRGGDRFLHGTAGVAVGNVWTTERTFANHFTKAFVQTGNSMPESAFTLGHPSFAETFENITGGSTLDATFASYFRITGSPTITSINGGSQGRTITIYCRSGTTTVNNSNTIALRDGVDAVIPARATLTLLKPPAGDGDWQEVSRSF